MASPQRRRMWALMATPLAAVLLWRVPDHARGFASAGRSLRQHGSVPRAGVMQVEPLSDLGGSETSFAFEGYAQPACAFALAGAFVIAAKRAARRPKTARQGTPMTEVKTASGEKKNGKAADEEAAASIASDIGAAAAASIASDIGAAAAAVADGEINVAKVEAQTQKGGEALSRDRADEDGIAVAARLAQAALETYAEISTEDKKEDGKKGWEYRKGIEGMSMGSLHYEMLTTDKDSKEFKALKKEYEGGWGVSFVNLPEEIKQIIKGGKQLLALPWMTTVNFLEMFGVDHNLIDGIPVQNKWLNIVADNVGEFTSPAEDDGGKKIKTFGHNMITGQMEKITGSPMPIFLEGYSEGAGLYKIVIGPKSVVVVSDPVILRHMLMKSQEYSKGILGEILEPIMGKGLIPADPITWRRRRRAITPGFHKGWLKKTTELVVECSENFCDELQKKIEDTPKGQKTILDLEEKFTSISLDIIGKAIFNYDFKSTGRESPVIKSVYSVLREAERRAQSVIPYWNLPGASEIFRDQKEHTENLMLLNAVLDELIRNCMEDLDKEDHKEGEHMSMLNFLVATKGEDVTTRQLRDDLMTLLIAGHETTAALLTWTLHEIMKPENVEIRDEIIREIDETLGGAPASYEDMKRLPKLRNCLMESLRLYPQPPLLIRRCDEGDDEVPTGPCCQGVGDTVKFLAGQDIFISTWSLHRAPQLWGEDAAVFRPDRWNHKIEGKDGWAGYDPSKSKSYPSEMAADFAFIPFGGGARKCVGDEFALLEAEVMMAAMLQRFDFKAASREDGAGEVGMTTGATIHTTGGLYVDVRPRENAPPLTRGSPMPADDEDPVARMAKKTSMSVADRLKPENTTVPTPRELNNLFNKQFEAVRTDDNAVNDDVLEDAYSKCQAITREHSKTFYLGSQLLQQDEQRVVWAIYNWCRSTDEMVDGPDSGETTMEDLEAWEVRLNKMFRKDALKVVDANNWEDLAMADSVKQFSLIERPFQDMVGGMAMDLVKERYATFEELEVYCYRVAGTVGLMTLPVLGFDGLQNFTSQQKEDTIRAAMALGVALQLTNILRDVGEDARRNRIYVPTEDLDRFGITHDEIIEAGHTPGLLFHEERWTNFMEFQMDRCEKFYVEAEAGIVGLSESNRMGVMAALFVYRGILPVVRRNKYDNFSQRAYVDFSEKCFLMAQAWQRCQELKEVAKENIRTGRIFSHPK